MKIYLAGRYGRRQELKDIARLIEQMGHTVTSRWLSGAHDMRRDDPSEEAFGVFAQEDMDDINACDVLISFTEKSDSGYGRGGRHVELGVALATGKKLKIIGCYENIFHYLPEVEFHPTYIDALLSLPAAENRS